MLRIILILIATIAARAQDYLRPPPPPPLPGNVQQGHPPPPHPLPPGPLRGRCHGTDPLIFDEPAWITMENCNTGPTCAYNWQGDEGIWVCRTLFDPFSGESKETTACIDSTKAVEKDECGCCGGECPSACECTCAMMDGAEGVLVQPTATVDAEHFRHCLPGVNALATIARGTDECATNCDL